MSKGLFYISSILQINYLSLFSTCLICALYMSLRRILAEVTTEPTFLGAAAQHGDDVGVRVQQLHHLHLLQKVLPLLIAGRLLQRLHRHRAHALHACGKAGRVGSAEVQLFTAIVLALSVLKKA